MFSSSNDITSHLNNNTHTKMEHMFSDLTNESTSEIEQDKKNGFKLTFG